MVSRECSVLIDLQNLFKIGRSRLLYFVSATAKVIIKNAE